MPGSLSEFWDFAADFKSMTAWIAKSAVAAPLVDIVLNIGPPWPSRLGVAIVVCIVEILVLMYAFEFWRARKLKIAAVQRRMQIGLLFCIVSFGFYMYLCASYVVPAPDHWHKVVIGTEMDADIAAMLAERPGRTHSENVLRDFAYQPELVWHERGIVRNRLFLLFAWMTTWIALSVVIAAFIALRWRRKPKQESTQ